MCGIALIINRIQFNLSSLFLNHTSSNSHQALFSVSDLEEALRRRGPDSLGSRRIFLGSKNGREMVPLPEKDAELRFFGATLQLRGTEPIVQPLVDVAGNVLVYNGEIFGGVHINRESNDAQVLMQYLGGCCSDDVDVNEKLCHENGEVKNSIADILSTIKGPWAFIYWQNSSKTLWFGRDAFGRRSLLVHWPTKDDSRFLLSSVSPASSIKLSSDTEVVNDTIEAKYWEELPCGIYSMTIDAAISNGCLIGEIKKHEWTNSELRELIKWERTDITPNSEELMVCGQDDRQSISSGIKHSKLALSPVEAVLAALRESVRQRTSLYTIFQVSSDDKEKELVPVAVLFSGGLDSMILAALLNECLDAIFEIDLLNVSFDGSSAPDRISARAGVNELKRIAPRRRWNLVEIDAELSKLNVETERVTSLIYPANTYMDLNIGLALWLAAGGDGYLYENIGNGIINEDHQKVKYKSKARILLVGSGADEQCAGYGRHRTKYRNGSWLGLFEEMKLDMQRIWKRNLGRDDRLIADYGKEARFPFLDEDVIRTLLKIPLWEVADLNQPSGKGDKKILREVAELLGLHGAAVLPKRAIQFGSRIARESNRKNFGSNRAANQASAGSVSFSKPVS